MMTGGSHKVRDWMRKRMMPRPKAARSGGKSGRGGDDASPLAAAAARRHDNKPSSSSSALLRWRKPRGNVLAALFRRVAYHLLWLVESVVVVARLLAFFVRFGFRL